MVQTKDNSYFNSIVGIEKRGNDGIRLFTLKNNLGTTNISMLLGAYIFCRDVEN